MDKILLEKNQNFEIALIWVKEKETKYRQKDRRILWVKFKHLNKAEDPKATFGARIISHLIGKYSKIRYRMWMSRKEVNEGKLHLQDLCRICLEHISPVTCPLALISQIRSSGGSLLRQLFDGHPELHSHPHELLIGYPETHIWPRIDLSDHPERWFDVLFEDIVSEYNKEGYKENKETFPFVFIPSLQREVFLNYLDSVQSITLRDVFDAYMTSYFGAWLSNQNYVGQKKFVMALTPSLAMINKNVESFFEVYSEGRLISIVRDPRNWYPSARAHWPERYGDVRLASSQWNESAQAILWNKEQYGDCVCLIQFEDFIGKTEAVMHFLAEFIGIEFDHILLTPTFNKFPVKANMSFEIRDRDALNSLLSTEKTLTEQEVETIDKETSETYSLVRRKTVRFE